MKYIKDGKIMLDGTYRECDIEEKLLKALEIIVDEEIDIALIKHSRSYGEYIFTCSISAEIDREKFDLLKEVIE